MKHFTLKHVLLLAVAVVGVASSHLHAQSTNCVGETGQGAFYSGVYRNIFKELLNKTDVEVNAKVNTAFQQIFYGGSTQKLYYEVGTDEAYILDVNNNDVRTEGMSYGMMICVQLDKQAEFDKIWKWAKTKMQYQSGNYQGYFAWQLNTDGTIKGNGPASDGEAYFVTSLFFAAHRWGSKTGIYNYEAEAQDILNKVMSKTGAGSVYNLFHSTSKLITFVPYGDSYTYTDPSYNLPGFWELWKRWSSTNTAFWAETPTASRKLLRDASNTTSGLTTDYSEFNGTPKTTSFNQDSHKFMYDAWRTIMNIGMDYHWFKADAEQPVIATKYLNFFKGQGASYKNHYNWDGTGAAGDHSTGLVACNAVGALAATDAALTTPFVQEFWNVGIPTGQYRYYDGMLYMLALLNCSGNFKVWLPCAVNKAPKASITLPVNNDSYAAGAAVNIAATATDEDGTVSKVEFYQGTTKLGEDALSPYEYSWVGAAEGFYALTAVAIDDKGTSGTSAVVNIKVGNPVVNMVTNGEFDNGTTGWTLQLNNSTAGTMTVATDANMSGTNSLRICPTTAGNADWNVQVSQTVGIVMGKTYEISYLAKADAARPMTTILQQGGGKYKTYMGAPVSLTTTSQPFKHTYTADTTDATALIKFFVGNNTTCVNIDNVVVKDASISTGLEKNDEAALAQVAIYPNPFHTELTIEAKGGFAYSIANQLGQIVATGKGENKTSLAHQLDKGVYFVTIENAFGKKTKKIVKE